MKKLLSIAIAGALFSQPVLAADMNKVLKVAFVAPETGFGPAQTPLSPRPTAPCIAVPRLILWTLTHAPTTCAPKNWKPS